MRFEKRQELPEIAGVGFARRAALPPLANEMRQPRVDGPSQIGSERQLGIRHQNVIERFRHWLRLIVPRMKRFADWVNEALTPTASKAICRDSICLWGPAPA